MHQLQLPYLGRWGTPLPVLYLREKQTFPLSWTQLVQIHESCEQWRGPKICKGEYICLPLRCLNQQIGGTIVYFKQGSATERQPKLVKLIGWLKKNWACFFTFRHTGTTGWYNCGKFIHHLTCFCNDLAWVHVWRAWGQYTGSYLNLGLQQMVNGV